MKRTANANWKGNVFEGAGTLTTQSKVFEKQPYSFKLRFENEDGQLGTNPEELIAAAHAGCFGMALSAELSKAELPPEELNVDAELTLEKNDAGFAITKILLKLDAKIPNIDEAKFMELAGGAKAGCPVSKVLNCDIDLQANLIK